MRTIRVPRIFGNTGSPLDQFERGYIFRISRAVPTALIGIVTLGLVAAVLGLLYSAVPPRPVHEPAPAVIPPEVTVSLQDVQGVVNTSSNTSSASATVPAASDGPAYAPAPAAAPGVDPTWVALARRVHQIRRLLEPRWSWDDRYESYCSSMYFGICYQTAQRQTAWGVSSAAFRAVNLFNDGNEEHLVYLPEANVSYELNVTGLARKGPALDELLGILRRIPAAQRLNALNGWTTLREQREQARAAQIALENQRVTEQREAEIARVAAARATRLTVRSTSLMAIAGGIGVVWMLGLTLALLAIERNTRLLGRSASAQSAAPYSSPPVESAVQG